MLKLGKTKLPHNKQTANMAAVQMPAPAVVTIPMVHQIGSAAIPCVKAGDKVFVGTKIANADGIVSASIHSSISGTVKKIDSFLTSDGFSCPTVIIESDGEMALDPSLKAPTTSNVEEFYLAIRESGLEGLGGADFPTAVKLEAENKGLIKKIIINATECEPFVTADNRTMIEDFDHIKKGVEVLEKFISAEEIVIGIDEEKTEAISVMKNTFASDSKVRIEILPSLYPQGEDKVIVYNTTGLVIPEGGYAHQVGCAVINVTTVAFIGHYFETGMPLVWKRITVDGSAVKEPKNLIVPVGTPIADVLNFAGGISEDLGKVLYDGPMKGIAIYSLNDPILKNTTAIVALTSAEAAPTVKYPCIHCGRCVTACPMSLNPTAISKAMRVEDKEDRHARLEAACIDTCTECGSCSFVCPSRRPLGEVIKFAKSELALARSHKTN